MFCYGSTEGSLSPPTFLCVGCKVLLETIGGGGAETGGRTPHFARRGEPRPYIEPRYIEPRLTLVLFCL